MRKIKSKNENKANFIGLICTFLGALTFISIAYSLFYEELSINSQVSISESAPNQYEVTSAKNEWTNENKHYYQFSPISLTYLGTEPTTGWMMNIKVPADIEIIGCWSAGECEVSNGILRIKNSNSNAILYPSDGGTTATTTVGIQFSTTESQYDLKVLSVNFYTEGGSIPTPTPTPTDNPNPTPTPTPTVEGFTSSLKKSGGWNNTIQYTYTLKNESTISLASWNVKIQFPAGTIVASIWGCNYIIDDNGLLTLSGPDWAAGLAIGSTTQEAGLQMTYSGTYTPLITSITGISTTGEEVVIK